MFNATAEALMLLIVLSIIAGIIGWILRGRQFHIIEGELNDARDANTDLQARLRQSEKQYQDKDNQFGLLDGKFKSAKGELKDTQGLVSERDKELRLLKVDVERQREQLGHFGELQMKFDELLPKYENNTAIAQELQLANDTFKGENSHLTTEVDVWKRKFEAYRLDNEAITNNFAALKTQLEEKTGLLSKQEREVSRINGIVETLQGKNNDLGAKINDLEAVILVSKKETEEEAARAETAEAASEEMRAQIVELQAKADDLHAKWSELQLANGKYIQEIEDLKARLATAQKQIEISDETIEELSEKIDASNIQLDVAKTSLLGFSTDLATAKKTASFDTGNLKTEVADLRQKMNEKATQIADLLVEADKKSEQIAALEIEANAKKAQIAELQAKVEAKTAAIADLDQQLSVAKESLQAFSTDLATSKKVASFDTGNLAEELKTTKKVLADLKEEKEFAELENQELQDRVKALEVDCNECSEKTADLRAQLEAQAAQLEVTSTATPLAAIEDEYEIEAAPAEDKKAEILNRIQTKAANLLDYNRIGRAKSDKDDLKRIKGIGPFTEDKLNKAGINSFVQVANFTEDDEDNVNDIIEFFAGRIRRDDWVGQAKEILGIKLTDKEIALARIKSKARGIDFDTIGYAKAADKDDLKRIKGIGPFIEKKLNSLGIYTFEQVSKFNETIDEEVNNAIEFFSGRVKRDDWKGQARILKDEK